MGKQEKIRSLSKRVEHVEAKHEGLFLRVAAQVAVECGEVCGELNSDGEKHPNPDGCCNVDCGYYKIWKSLKMFGSLK